MSKLKYLTNKFKPEGINNNSNDQQDESNLVRRMSASSDGIKNDSIENNRDDLLETYRSVSEIPKKKMKSKFWNFFDWSFKNLAYSRMSPENKKWLLSYKYMSYIAMFLLIIAYIFFILLLCSPLVHVDAGEIKDEELFVPVTESLLHSVVALWQQKAYLVVFVVFLFSISLPFIKMIATTISYYITARHRRKQIELFFGSKINQDAHIRFLSGESSNLNNEYINNESQESLEYTKYEDGRLIKYAREILLILKLISKFQMVDLIILMLNVAFLRSAFAWAKPGMGMLYLFIYCVASIFGTQLLNLAVEGEREMFDYWKAVRLICLPNLDRYYNNSYQNLQENVVVDLGMKSLGSNNMLLTTDININKSEQYDINKEVEIEMKEGLNIIGKSSIIGSNIPTVFNIMSKNSGIDILSNCTSEIDYYDLLFMDKKKEIKMRWYRSNIFICFLVIINLISAGMIISKEKMFGIAFTADQERIFGADGTQMSFFEIIFNIRDCWNYLPVFVFFFLSIFIPVIFHIMFLTGLFLYNFCVNNKGFNSLSKFDPGKPMIHPYKCLYMPVKITKFIFKFCNLLSEWSLGEVLALGFVAGFVSIWTAPNIRFYIPPKKISSVFIIMGAFGLSSFLLNVQFFMWYTRIINRLSDVTIYIESVHSMTSSTNSEFNSNSNFEDNNNLNLSINENNELKMIIKESNDNLKKLESYIETNRNNIIYEQNNNNNNEEDKKKKKKIRGIKKMLFKIIDFIRHIIYSKFIVSVFFAIIFILIQYFFIYSFAFKYEPSIVNANKVQNLIDNGLPKIFNLIAKNAPKTYGDCNYKVVPPQPCVGSNSIYQYRSALMFDLVWVTGLNTVQLIDARFLVTEDKRLQFRIHVKFSGLRPYVKAGFCTHKCNTLFAGDKMCCGDDVHAVAVLSVSCNDTFPHLRDIRVDEMKVQNLKFKNEIDFILDQLVKIQEILEKQLTKLANDFLEKQDSILVWRGVPMSLLDFINFLLKVNFPAGIKCSV